MGSVRREAELIQRRLRTRVPPYTANGRVSAMVEFPGGYIAEISRRCAAILRVERPGSLLFAGSPDKERSILDTARKLRNAP